MQIKKFDMWINEAKVETNDGILNLKSQTDLSGFYIIFYGSTNLEESGTYGVSHLCEHLVCKSFDHLQEDFDRDGVDWNMYTSSNEVVFYMQGLDPIINEYKGKVLDLITTFNITPKQFENEKRIVLEEYYDAFNKQDDNHFLNLMRKLFNDYNPIGLKEDLEKLTFEDMKTFFLRQYSKPSKIINVSKNSEFKRDIELSANISDRKLIFGDYDAKLDLSNDFKDKTSLILVSPVIDEDFNYINFINCMLGMGLKSPLYQEVREKEGLVYFIHCSQSRVNNQGFNTISTLTSNGNVDKVIEAIKRVRQNPDEYLTEERFDIVKKSFTVERTKSEILRYAKVNKWINPEGWSIYDILDTVTLEKIREVYDKYYSFDKFYISNDKTEFSK